MTSRYQHVPAQVLHDVAGLVGGLLWSSPRGSGDELATAEDPS